MEKFYFVLEQKYGAIYSISKFKTKEEMEAWKKEEKRPGIKFLYISKKPESEYMFGMKKEEWGM